MDKHIRIYSAKDGLNHITPDGHPECPARLDAIYSLLGTAPYNTIERTTPNLADDNMLSKVHSKAHLFAIGECAPQDEGDIEYIDGDTVMSYGTLRAARMAAGAVYDAVNDIHAGHNKIGLCINRPPGHHATYNQAMGFCFFNNVMLGVARAAELGYKRIAVIDFDVHHGNGCTDILQHVDLPCFYFSTHQSAYYPGTGHVSENIDDKIFNLPLPAGTSREDLCNAYTDEIFPRLNSYAPDFVFISAGFDAHKDDPYGDFNLIEDDYNWLTTEIKKIAQTHADGRLISVLEGGYNLNALKASYAAHINALR